MEKFTVNQLAQLAKVSVRTLHHYDQLGLLKPWQRSEKGYRYYGRNELLRLQQILLYKELGLQLVQIAEILDEPGFDMLKALQAHKTELLQRQARMSQLLVTVDKTIEQLKTNSKMNYEELYKGFSKEQAEAYNKEASERWGADTIAESHQRLMAMSKQEWAALKQQGEDINAALVKLMHLQPTDKKVQDLIAQHYVMTGKHFNVTPEIYASLGNMYVNDERFKAYYDRYDTGLAAFLRDGILAFCENKK